ncbi:hypothetical protein ID853_10970 [Xenorhabdus sp. Vera]|uniref:hypothetical protein n=1 Tax=Xenorhabdus koppenhoeferi TaxID=351659 RepID=UPI0019A488C9|nr:hypothetical protein [Xenorhabdus sp. Vera]MBD2811389.1 hypothetical protein [Xenorhabdus sp. Vera]
MNQIPTPVELKLQGEMKQCYQPLSSGLFIQIENKYTWVQDMIFPLSHLRAIYPCHNSGQTVALMIDGMSAQCPSVSYKTFMQFFTDVIHAIEKLKPQAFIFKLTVNEDLSCEWCDFHRTNHD